MTSLYGVEVHGHRGARAVRPENTLPAFEYAIGVGVDVLELDLGVTKDNVLVVSHDPHLNAQICEGPQAGQLIRSLTLEQVKAHDCGAKRNPGYPKQQTVPGTRMPTLDEVFTLKDKGKFKFNIETKIFPNNPDWTVDPVQFAELVLAAIRKHKLESRVIVQSFDFRTLIAIKKLAPEIQTAALIGAPNIPWLDAANRTGAKIVSPVFTLVTPEKVAQAHAAGLQVVPWTPNDPAQWDKMLEAKVEAIITDDPEPLLKKLGRK